MTGAHEQKQLDCRKGSLGLICSALGLGQAIQATLLDLHVTQQLRTQFTAVCGWLQVA